MPGKRKKRRQYCNKQKKRHLLNVLNYAIGNMETLQGQKDRKSLRAIARTLRLSSIGVRVRHENDEVGGSFPGPHQVERAPYSR